jgi:hypothetical protein
MSRFDNTPPVPAKAEPVMKIKVEGSFYCQYCPNDVDFAFYLPETSILTWQCDEKHVSMIKDFVL